MSGEAFLLSRGEWRPFARPIAHPVTTMTTARTTPSFRETVPNKGGDYPAPGGMLRAAAMLTPLRRFRQSGSFPGRGLHRPGASS